MTTGKTLARNGQNLALANAALRNIAATSELRDTLGSFIEHSRRTGKHFTTDEIKHHLSPETVAFTHERPNVFPAMVARASQTGRITEVGRHTAASLGRHGGDNRIWTARKDTRHGRA